MCFVLLKALVLYKLLYYKALTGNSTYKLRFMSIMGAKICYCEVKTTMINITW